MTDTKVAPWINLPAPDAAMEIEARGLLEQASAYEIADADMREAATIDLVAIKRMADTVEAKRKEITGPLDQAKKAVMALFAPMSDTLADARRVLEGKILTFDRKVAAEQAAERARQEAAARAQREALEAQAKAAEKAGQAETAAALEAAATMVAAAPVIVEQARGATSTRETWSAEFYDMKALARAIADGAAPVELIAPNEAVGNALARARRSADLGIPGVRGVAKQSLAAKRAA